MSARGPFVHPGPWPLPELEVVRSHPVRQIAVGAFICLLGIAIIAVAPVGPVSPLAFGAALVAFVEGSIVVFRGWEQK